MFCIKSDVIILGSIEMYGFVTIWASMDDGPYWVILLMYGSHDMRHRFPQVDSGQQDPRVLGRHTSVTCSPSSLASKPTSPYVS